MFQIAQRIRSLETLIISASARELDEQMASYLCKLGCVLICGNLERCVEILVTERIGSRSAPQVKPFLRSYFMRGTGYDCEQIRQLLFRFDSDWGRQFELFINGNERIKEGIASCYAVRNSIAHGGGQSLGPVVLRQYYEASVSLISALETILREN